MPFIWKSLSALPVKVNYVRTLKFQHCQRESLETTALLYDNITLLTARLTKKL